MEFQYLDDDDELEENSGNSARVDQKAHRLEDDWLLNKWWWKVADREADKMQARRSFLIGSSMLTRRDGRK